MLRRCGIILLIGMVLTILARCLQSPPAEPAAPSSEVVTAEYVPLEQP